VPRFNLSFFQDLLSTISEQGHRLVFQNVVSGSGQLVPELVERLLSGQGEASGIALARELLNGYASLDQNEKREFFEFLLNNYGPDHDAIASAVQKYQSQPEDETAIQLFEASEPRRQELLRRLNLASGATASLVAMRSDLITFLKDNPALKAVDRDFYHLLSSWFNRGFLVLRRIDWNTPAIILEKIIQYEAVHAIKSWEDLRNRIEPKDRRCYAFFHPALADEPLIFVEVALTGSTPDGIALILDMQRTPSLETDATTAAFYSISNCQVGLKGISFGSFLIKQVAEELKRDLPGLKDFVTLSPVPGFKKWLDQERGLKKSEFFTSADNELLSQLENESWLDEDANGELSSLVLNIASRYFLEARDPRGRLVDPVARFHLGNGAQLEHIHWQADCSFAGLSQSYGLMVNYLYDLAVIERNHESFMSKGLVVASAEVEKLKKTKKTKQRNRSERDV